VINVMPAVLVFSIREIVRPVDAGKIANSAQHPKSLGTAELESCSNHLRIRKIF